MWFKKKKVEEPKTETVVETPKVEESPKETTRKEIMKLVLVNNKTDKEYNIESENDFGLTWTYTGQKNGNYELLVINQKLQIDESKWTSVGRFVDFSIVKCEWKTFDIV